MSSAQDPPVLLDLARKFGIKRRTHRFTPHRISEEADDPASLLLPTIASGIQGRIQHRHILDVQDRSLEQEAGGEGIQEVGGIGLVAYRLSYEGGNHRRYAGSLDIASR